MPDYIIPIISIIIGTIIGMMFLRKYDLLEKFAISITIEILLYIFNFILVYIALILISMFKTDIDYNMLVAIGTLFAIVILGPCFCYSINKYGKDKKISNCIFLIFIFIFIYLLILFIISLFL